MQRSKLCISNGYSFLIVHVLLSPVMQSGDLSFASSRPCYYLDQGAVEKQSLVLLKYSVWGWSRFGLPDEGDWHQDLEMRDSGVELRHLVCSYCYLTCYPYVVSVR